MSDALSAAAELRSLEEKRRSTGLTPDEEARRTALASGLVGGSRGFDVGAAAARVRAQVGGGTPAHEGTAVWDLGTVPVATAPAAPAPAEASPGVTPEEAELVEADLVEPEPLAPAAAATPPALPGAAPAPGADPTLGSPVDLAELLSPAAPPLPAVSAAPAPPPVAAAAPPAAPSSPPAPAAEVARLTPIPCLPGDAPPAPPPQPGAVPGAHRVVLHTADGLVKRGVVTDFDPGAVELWFASQDGEPATPIAAEAVHALFFMLAPAEPPPAPRGRKVQVTFRDGRQLSGTSEDYHPDRAGFFVVPLDGRTRTARIWIYRSAARRVTVE